jgi:biotin operon repressor
MHNTYTRWTNEDEKLVMEQINDNQLNYGAVAAMVGRSESAIGNKVADLRESGFYIKPANNRPVKVPVVLKLKAIYFSAIYF